MSNLTGYERDALNQIHAKDTTIARLQFGLVVSAIVIIGLFVLTYYLAMLV